MILNRRNYLRIISIYKKFGRKKKAKFIDDFRILFFVVEDIRFYSMHIILIIGKNVRIKMI